MASRTSEFTSATDQAAKKGTSQHLALSAVSQSPGLEKGNGEAGLTRLLIASLETIGTPFILLEAGVVSYLTPPAYELLGLPVPRLPDVSPLVGKSWASAWADL